MDESGFGDGVRRTLPAGMYIKCGGVKSEAVFQGLENSILTPI